jgi:PBP1b-binding outer membrane lipoprotein LpoB
MKTCIVILIIVLAVLACGCTNSSPAGTAPVVPVSTATVSGAPATAPAIPNLVGTWSGTANAYDEGIGYSSYNNGTITMVVTEQQGRIFSGNFVFTSNGNTSTSLPMAAAIGSDGRTFQLVEKDHGYTSGEILPGNTIELIYCDSNTPYSIAIDTLKRV